MRRRVTQNHTSPRQWCTVPGTVCCMHDRNGKVKNIEAA